MKKITLIFFISFINNIIFSQSDYTFKKIIDLPFGGYATSVKQSSDEGYIICGSYYDSLGYLAGNFLLKLSKDGSSLWYKEFPHPWNFAFRDLTIDLAGNIYVSGSGPDTTGGTDINLIILKTNSSGTILWSKSYGGLEVDLSWSVDLTSDNNILATGWTESYESSGAGATAYTIKVDLNGNLLWNKFYGDSTFSANYCVKEVYPNKYVTLGSSGPSGDYGRFSVFDNNGNILVSKNISYSDWLFLPTVTRYNNGGYLIAGSVGSFSGLGSLRPFLMALDSSYNFLWAKKYVTPTISDAEEFISINRTSDGNYITSFEPEGVNGTQKSFGMMKLDDSGAIIWGKLYEQNYFAYPYRLIETKDSGYIEVGFIQKQISLAYQQPFVIKSNNLGIINGCISDTSISSVIQNVVPIITPHVSISSNCIVNNISVSYSNLIMLDSIYCVDSVPSTNGMEQYLINNEVFVYPNPASSGTTFSLSTELKKGVLNIFDVTGKKISSKDFSGLEVSFNRNQLSNGMYFYTIDAENKIIAKGKLIFK